MHDHWEAHRVKDAISALFRQRIGSDMLAERDVPLLCPVTG